MFGNLCGLGGDVENSWIGVVRSLAGGGEIRGWGASWEFVVR